MKKIALITGVSGQDGSYLAEFLLKKKYLVIGADRRSARSNMWRHKRLGIDNKIIYEELELAEPFELEKLLKKYKFTEFYNLAAQSFVATSFNSPINTANITAISVVKILETIRQICPYVKFYQASSSEMFGDILEKKQNEKTPFNPQSPYAVSKVFGHFITTNYRKAYKLFAVSGILFNHESPLRGEEFITRKISLGLIKIINNDTDNLEVGNIYAKRDWGHSKEYVEAMWKMLQQKTPDDFVIATGKAYSVKQFINESCKVLNLEVKWLGTGLNEKLVNIKNNKTIITINPKFFRPTEVNILVGDSAKAKKKLGWSAKITFKDLVKEIIQEEIKYYK